MRKLSTAAVAMILAIAFYFTLFWGFDALRMLTSPTYGLEEVWRSQFVFEIGRLFGLAPLGLIKLAAFFATLKLAVAAICAVHIADRFRALGGGTANTDILDAGLVLVMLITHRLGRSGDLVAQCRAGARAGDHADAGRRRRRPRAARAQLSARGQAAAGQDLVDCRQCGRPARRRVVLAAALNLSRHFGSGSFKPRSGGSSLPLRRSFTACISARAALRTSSCTLSSLSRSSWLVA